MHKLVIGFFIIVIIIAIVVYVRNKKQYEVEISTPEGPKVVELPFPKDSVILTPGQRILFSPDLLLEYRIDGSICMLFRFNIRNKDYVECLQVGQSFGSQSFGVFIPTSSWVPGASSEIEIYSGLPIIGKFNYNKITTIKVGNLSTSIYSKMRSETDHTKPADQIPIETINHISDPVRNPSVDNNPALDQFRLFKNQ